MFSSTTLLSNKRSVHFARPTARLRADQGDELALSLAVEDARNGRRRALLAVQRRVHAALSKL
ncbi:MAG: hypothetical protein ACREM8_13705, partial [Vulcanimicrobiaceae bacterium]